MINKLSMEGTAVFLASLHQYISVCVAFSISKPFRRPIHTNRIFLVYLILVTICNVYVTLIPAKWVRDLVSLVDLPFSFRVIILVVAFCNFIVTFYFERVMVISFLNFFKRWRAARKRRPTKPYKWLEKYAVALHHSSRKFLSSE
jgi:cation-transporting ATPase 13A2